MDFEIMKFEPGGCEEPEPERQVWGPGVTSTVTYIMHECKNV